MITAQVCVGDTLATLLQITDLKNNIRHEIHFLDMPTGGRRTVAYEFEMDAIGAFAAWLLADTALIKFAAYRDRLYRDLAGDRLFLP